MPFALRPEDLSFPDRALVRLAFSRLVPVPPERAFDVLADHEAWTRWFVDFKKASVAGGVREGVGMKRRVWVGPMVLDERFIAWERGRRFSFTMLQSNLPILSAMVETGGSHRSRAARGWTTRWDSTSPAGSGR
ncbi:MAG: SRPBCC family protein [Holophagales bacterium]|nr:SRPBCC family protein [Holophagales bacterium]